MTRASSLSRPASASACSRSLRECGGQHHGAAHHLQRVLAPGDHDRRRIAAHALHGGEQPGDLVVALGQRAAQQLFLRLELAEPGLDAAELAFAVLDQAGRLDQALVEPLALQLQLADIGGQPLLGALPLVELLPRSVEPLLRVQQPAAPGRASPEPQR